MKKLLPVALDVEGRRVLIVGGGAVAGRKAAALAECGAEITVIAPELSFQLPGVRHEPRLYQPGDEAGFDLVFAATDDAKLNRQIAEAAKAAGAWVNDASAPQESDFHTAAVVRRQDIAIGITTGGVSPVLAKHVRERIEAALGPEYEVLLQWRAADPVDLKHRGEFWRRILASRVLVLIRDGRHVEAQEQLEQMKQELSASPSD
jgi:siroheme synthase-like protein